MTRLHYTPKEATAAILAIIRRDYAHPQVAKLGRLHESRLQNVSRILDHVGADRPQGVVHMVSGGEDTVCGRFACDETMTTADINMVTCYKCRKESDGSEVPKPKLVKPRVKIDASGSKATVTLGSIVYVVATKPTKREWLLEEVGTERFARTIITDNVPRGIELAVTKLRNEFPTITRAGK